MWKVNTIIFIIISIRSILCDDSDFNDINSDGSFQFGLSNSDFGSHSHSAIGNANGVVRGRYASRNPETGRVEETQYTAGPRGFRARGPQIHRQMDLSQIPRGPIGTPDDPLADPYDDPSYNFQFQTQNYNRRENSDRNGRVRGLYSYIDDIGERHTVRYAAGKETGFEVFNAVPDAPSNVRYNSPLYLSNDRQKRGHMSVERGPPGQYRFISTGPDQRRSESMGSDGIVRGSYSFLDDKGVQRTVQYEAGAGIGYRVIKTTVGPLTHVLPAPIVPVLGLRDNLANDISAPISNRIDDQSSFTTPPSRPFTTPANRPYSTSSPNRPFSPSLDNDPDGPVSPPRINRPFSLNQDNEQDGPVSPPRINRPFNLDNGSDGPIPPPRNPNNLNNSGRNPAGRNPNGRNPGLRRRRPIRVNDGRRVRPNNHGPSNSNNLPEPQGPLVTTIAPIDGLNTELPESTFNIKKLNDDRDEDWKKDGKDSTIIKNVGDDYVGLPPGSAVRAHVQSIDLIPLGERAPSPADALRRESEDDYY